MMIKFVRFNIYLSLGLCLLFLSTGCQSMRDKKKNLTVVELHLEVRSDGTSFSETVPVFRAHPMDVTIERESFVDVVDIEGADVVDELGGFKIRFKFNWRGTELLNSITAANRGKRIVVMCAFPDARWIAAPMIRNQISDGVFTFTPDCTRAEADRIVKGLKDVTGEIKASDKF